MSELLSAVDRAELEQINADNMDARATITREPTSGASIGVTGTRTTTPVVIGTLRPCRVSPAVDFREVAVGEQVTALARRQVSWLKGEDVMERDRIDVAMGRLVAGVWTATGETLALEVIGVAQPHSYDVLRSTLCKLAGTP